MGSNIFQVISTSHALIYNIVNFPYTAPDHQQAQQLLLYMFLS